MLTEERINELAWVARSAGPDVMELVRQSLRQAAIESANSEREACARVCDVEAAEWRGPKYSYAAAVGEHCANKIRMRYS